MTASSLSTTLLALGLLACGTASTPGGTGATGGHATETSGAGGTMGSSGSAGQPRGGTSGTTTTGGAPSTRGAAGSHSAGQGTGGIPNGSGARAGAPSGGATTSGAGGQSSSTNGGAGSSSGAPDQAGAAGAASDCHDEGFLLSSASCLPPEQPSTQTVYFDITNTAASEIYVVTSGRDCTAYSIHSVSTDSDLSLLAFTDWGCPCGMACEFNIQSFIQELGPGETVTLTWDARDLIWHGLTVPDSCNPANTTTENIATPQPVSAGQYSVSVGYYLPPPCEYCGLLPTYAFGTPPQCRADHNVSASFVLPDAGDVHVPIEISAPLGN